jgi:hypothetical protein
MTMKFPTGNVRTHRTTGPNPYNFPWSRTAAFSGDFERAAAAFKLDPYDLAAISVIESDSTHYGESGAVISRYDRDPKYPSVGITQVKPGYHQWRTPGEDAYTPSGNIFMGASVLAAGVAQYGTIEGSLAYMYHPGVDPNGTTPNSYIAVFHSLVKEITNATAPVVPPSTEPPKPAAEQRHPYDIIGGGHPWNCNYRFLQDEGLNYYSYGVGHGSSAPTQHTGDDVLWPDETPLFAIGDGRVTCVGWEGEVTWGQGCGYFADEEGGIGNISILLDSGHKVVYGHSSVSYVSAGERVAAGQKVGLSGGMNGPHTHIEVAVRGRDGTYWLLDPAPALREAMGGEPIIVPVERAAVPQPKEFDAFWQVQVLEDGVPVLQRARPSSPQVASPFKAGETFNACYIAIGENDAPYYIGEFSGRVPLDARTQGPAWLTRGFVPPECPPDQSEAFLEELQALIDKYQTG